MDFTQNQKKPGEHSNKKILFSILISLLMLVSFAGGYFMHLLTQSKSVNIVTEVVDIVDKVGFVYDPTTNTYVELDGDKVAQSIANNFLDQYSEYYTKEEYQRIKEQAKGNYVAFGLQFYTELNSDGERVNTNRVGGIIYNSPAEEKGVEIDSVITALKVNDGDKIFITNGEQLSDLLSACIEGDEVEFFFNNNEEGIKITKSAFIASYVTYCDSQKTVRFLSAEVGQKPVATIDTTNVLPDLVGKNDVAYVKLVSFEGNADEQFSEALKIMKQSEKHNLILDLRDNGGGYLDILTEIASNIFPFKDDEKKLHIACSVGKEKNNVRQDNWYDSVKDNSLKTESGERFIENIYVLANEHTASASEALIGAMIHYKGRIGFGYQNLILEGAEGTLPEQIKTYGKGIMQTTYELKSGGALKLTTAKIYWPDWDLKSETGTCIQGVGIMHKPENYGNCVYRSTTKDNALLKALEKIA